MEDLEKKNDPTPLTQTPLAASTTTTPANTSRGLFLIQKLLKFFWLLFFAIVLVAYIGTYVFRVHNAFMKTVTSFVPTPFGFVGSHPLWLHSFDQKVDALNHFYGQQSGTTPSTEMIHAVAEQNMIRRAVANDLARQYNVWVSHADLTSAYNGVETKATSSQHVTQAIENLWGLSAVDYQRNVLAPFVLETKLAEVLIKDPVIGRDIGSADNLQALNAYLDKVGQRETNIWFDPSK